MIGAAEHVVPLRACEAWCTESDLHANEHPEDRSCWSEFLQVPLRLGKAEKSGAVWYLDHIEAVLRRRPESVESTIVLHVDSTDAETVLTIDEATRLRDYLTELLGRL